MGTSARSVLSVVALVQLLLLGASTAVLVYRLRTIEAEVERLGREENGFLGQLDALETDLFRLSLLLRDSLTNPGPHQANAKEELSALLQHAASEPQQPPGDIAPELRTHLHEMEEARQAYVQHVREISSWPLHERRAQAPTYLSQRVSPVRERFSTAAAKIASVVRAARARRNQATSASIHQIERLTLQLLLGSAALGLVIAGCVLWKFRQYQEERDQHLKQLTEAEEGSRALSQRLLEAQEEERKHLSRELHDEVGQVLTALRVQLDQAAVDGDTNASRHLRQATQLADRSLRTVRQIAHGLRPAMLDDLGLAPTLKWLGRDVSNTTGLDIEVEVDGELKSLEDSRRTCVYRVVQEALTNCVKHSHAHKACVYVQEKSHDLLLKIWDNGVGAVLAKHQGIGLLGMRERVEELGGTFGVVTAPGKGLTIHISLPKRQQSKKAEVHEL